MTYKWIPKLGNINILKPKTEGKTNLRKQILQKKKNRYEKINK